MSLKDAARECGMSLKQVRPGSCLSGAGDALLLSPTTSLLPGSHHSRTSRTPRQFKQQCRKLNIARWPHRKLRSIQHLIAVTEVAAGRNVTAAVRAQLQGWVDELRAIQVRCRDRARSLEC